MRPESEEALADAIKGANGPLRVCGGGTRWVGPAVEGERLETGGLSGITLYEPGALTLVARAGTPVAEIEAALAEAGQRLAFEPHVAAGSTIGGVVAANASGPRRISQGACRDFLLGVRFVDGAGRVLKNGGRVMKNVTGYDLVKLLAGSRGTLGVLTEVSLKVLPVTETEATLTLPDLPPARAVAAMSAALGSPFEVTGAAWLDGRVAIRIEGFTDSVAYRAGRLTDLLAPHGAAATTPSAEESRVLWQQIATPDPFPAAAALWRVGLRPSDAPTLLDRLEGRAQGTRLDWGGGLLTLGLLAGTDLRAAMEGLPGHATLLRAPEGDMARLGAFHPEPPALAALSQGLRARFDPRGILNPGLMG